MTTRTPDQSRAARRTKQFHSAKDFEASASQIGQVDPFSEEIKTKAQRIIAGNARGRSKKAQVEDATTLMRMLGVHPDDRWEEPITGLMPSPNSKR